MPAGGSMGKERLWAEVYLAFALITFFYSAFLIVKFRRDYRAHPIVFSKRHPKLLLALVVAVVVSSFVAGPVSVVGHMKNASMYVTASSIVLNQFFMATIYMIFTMVWMVRFEIKLTRLGTHKQWTMYLDENWGKKCWFVENRSSLGRLFIASKMAGVVWFFFAVPYVALFLSGYGYVAKVILLVQCMPPMMLGAKVWYDTPEIGDVFHVRDQVKWLVWLALTDLILYSILMGFAPTEYSSFLFGFLFSLTSPIFLNVLLEYPVRLFKADKEELKTKFSLSTLSTLSTSSTVKSSSSIFKSQKSTSNTERSGKRRSSMGRQVLREILSNVVTFECFMEHLLKEFSYENLLFVVEVTQFKQNLLANFPYLKRTPGLNHGVTVRLPHEIPKSVFIHDNHQSAYDKGQYLYDKYVDVSSILEVNIAYETRVNLAKIFLDAVDGFVPTSVDSSPRTSVASSARSSFPTTVLPQRTSSELGAELHDIVRVNSSSDSQSHTGEPGKDAGSIAELYSAFDAAYSQIMTLLLDSLSRFRRMDGGFECGSV